MKGLWKPQQSSVILGEIAKDNFWETTIELASQTVEVDINVPDGELDPEQLDYIRTVVTKLDLLDMAAREAIRHNYDSPYAEYGVKDYMTFCLEELDGSALGQLFQTDDPGQIGVDTFLESHRLCRCGFYPNELDSFAVLDYTLSRLLMDYLIVVNFSENCRVWSVCIES